MDFKDYYAILGVAPDADKKTIQLTFRKLARKHHPDVNPGNKEAEEKFKTFNEAYQVLSDAKQRKKYDELRSQYLQWQQTGGRKQDFDWQNWSASQGKPARSRPANDDDLEDLFGSSSPYSDFFNDLFNQASGSPRNSGPRQGRTMEYELDLTLKEAFQGSERLLEIDGRRIKAGIPAGVRSGSRVRLAGQGEPGRNSGAAGDLYLIVRVLPDQTFEREGDNLRTEILVDFFSAIAGGEIRVPTMEQALILKIPPGTNAGQNFRLRGKGMPHLGDPKTRGDMLARVKLVLPEHLSDLETQSIREMASARNNQAQPDLNKVQI